MAVLVGPRTLPSMGLLLKIQSIRLPRRGSKQAFESGAAEMLEGLARSLRAGLTIPQAFDELAGDAEHPAYVATKQVNLELSSGTRFEDAFAALAALPGMGSAVDAILLGAQGGGEEARALDSAAEAMRDRAAVRSEAQAQASQAKASAVVMGLAPLAFAGLTILGGGPSGAFLLGTFAGRACLIAALAMDATGLWWMRRLIDGAVR